MNKTILIILLIMNIFLGNIFVVSLCEGFQKIRIELMEETKEEYRKTVRLTWIIVVVNILISIVLIFFLKR